MKIGIIGNMNNMYFSLARYLRDEGLNCELLVLADEPLHFDPSCDTYTSDYKTYCRHVKWGSPSRFLYEDRRTVKSDLGAYDFLIGSGPAPAYAARAGHALDVFMPYGHDLYRLPFFPQVLPHHLPAYLSLRHYQRRGIRQSKSILFDRTNRAFERIVQKLACEGQRIVTPLPLFYYKDYESALTANDPALPKQTEVERLRRETDLLIIQHGRQVWKRSLDRWSFKGNDILFHGFSRFIQQHPETNIKLLLLEYGTDVMASKKMIGQLGLGAYVHWLPQMPRKELMKIVALSDLVVGELQYSWLTYGVAIEALFLGKPLMHKRIDDEFSADYLELYPMLHAQSPQSVYDGLVALTTNTASVRKAGRKGRDWFFIHCVQKPITLVKKLVEQKRLAGL